MALGLVRDLRRSTMPSTPEEIADFEIDLLAEFTLARAAAGLTDATIRRDVAALEQIRTWLGQPLWEMTSRDADSYFGKVLKQATNGTKTLKACTLEAYFQFLDLRYRAQLFQLTGHVVESPLDEVNRPRGREVRIRIPPAHDEIEALFAGWREELLTCRKFAPTARTYAACRMISQVGLRINETCRLDLADVKWALGTFGKLHVRFGKGSRASGPRERMVPLINGADRVLRWFIEDVWGHFDNDDLRPGAPLFPSERRHGDGTAKRVTDDGIRAGLNEAVAQHLPTWKGKLTPHVLRHYCASQLYLSGMDLLAVQELLGHAWILTTMRYVHVNKTHVEDAWIAGQQRAADRLKGLLP
ncbi:tyrosine-type recombinase/integrase [Nonomuraea polychroma]|uniref:tyrosine-type recombinase/integrase n=1 Tax=Nonomuraea polychroma TaxID=46176 RepID=UPI003D8AF2FF